MRTITTNEKPLYKHDCSDCIYLASNEAMDFYFCKKSHVENDASLIIRLSNKPSDYYSMPASVADKGIKTGELDKDSVFAICHRLYLDYINK